jgi:hypothetical protein
MERPIPFFYADGANIFFFSSYRTIWDQAYDDAIGNLEAKDDAMPRQLIVGNPGIGKSRSMVYILRKALLEGRTVIWESQQAGQVFRFQNKKRTKDGSNSGYISVHTHQDWRPSNSHPDLDNPECVYLIDPGKAEMAKDRPLVCLAGIRLIALLHLRSPVIPYVVSCLSSPG